MFSHLRPIATLTAIALLLPLVAALSNPTFSDVTVAAGIDLSAGRVKKYGGPGVVDLDRDGYPDLLFCHHDSIFTELYFNNRRGGFIKAPWGIFHDSHGFSAFPVSPWHRTMRFSLSVGGNYGLDPLNPLMFEVTPSRQIREVTQQAAITKRGGRGRTGVYLDLSMGAHPYWPDVIYTNAFALKGSHQFAYENVGNQSFALRQLRGGYEWTRNPLAAVTDIDGDGIMEVLSYWSLEVWKLNGPFSLVDVSTSVLPPGLPREGVTSIAEFDFNNDGKMDLYLARARVGPWLPDVAYEDILLQNVGGRYVDVSQRAGIPRGTVSKGVTTGDFNNDGHMDIHVTQYNGADILLLNNGNGTFRRIAGIVQHAAATRGDNSVAVDYDLDGRVDLVVSEGDQDTAAIGGTFRIFKNNLALASDNHYINIRVGNPWNRSCTPLNAVVFVRSGNLTMTRRVGSPGTSISHSYMETLHFGLGSRTKVDVIYVKYTNGFVVSKHNVNHGQTVVLGLL